MRIFLFFLYTFAVKAGDVYIYVGSFFSEKLKLLRPGRKNTWKILNKTIVMINGQEHLMEESHVSDHYPKRVWIHCASLGEFEQGRPVIEKIKQKYPDSFIFLSFFSPSGYEIQKNYDKADAIFYLPADTPENCDRLLNMIRPNAVIFVKYEFWWNLIRNLVSKNINIFLISAVFRENDYFFKSLLRPFGTLLHQYKMIFVQDNASAEILTRHEITNFVIAGDTRIDRVIERSKSSDIPMTIREYTKDKKVIVYGSVWESDMSITADCIQRFSGYIHIVAPHDISPIYVEKLRKLIPVESSLYSDATWVGNVLIINNIGLLSSLYSIARYVYIGGGFQKGIHNILEPAVFSIPVFFGPNHQKFNEALILQAESVAFSIVNSTEMTEIIDNFEQSESEYASLSKRANEFFHRSQGATEKTVSIISSYL